MKRACDGQLRNGSFAKLDSSNSCLASSCTASTQQYLKQILLALQKNLSLCSCLSDSKKYYKKIILCICVIAQFFAMTPIDVSANPFENKNKSAEKIRDTLFKCKVANRFYDIIHHNILKNASFREMHNVKLALCSTKRTDSSKKSDRDMFVRSITAVVNWVNKAIFEQRSFILKVQHKIKNNIQLAKEEKMHFSMICSFYQTDNIDELLDRVAPVPVSLAVAQAALESGFGSNLVIHRNNAFFGMMRDKEMLCSFDTLLESTIAYTKTLNVNRCYKKFRANRAQMIARNEKIKGDKLSEFLGWYSTNKRYRGLILQIMREYNLGLLDMTALSCV